MSSSINNVLVCLPSPIQETEQELQLVRAWFNSSGSLKTFLFQRSRCFEFRSQVGVHEPVDLRAQSPENR